MVLECNSADTGVGATIAPSNQLENGSWADFVMPAKHNSAAGRSDERLVGGVNHRLQFDAAGLPVQPHNGHREGESAGQVHHQRPQRVVLRLIGLRVTNQQERAERGDFPEEVQPHQVVGENEAEHRAHEDEQQREEKRTPVRNVAMRDLVVLPHVAQRVKANAAAHQAVDQGHDHGELVHEQILRHLQMLALRQLEPNHQTRLGQRQRHDQRAFRAHTDVNDVNAHPDLDELHAQVDPIGIQ